MSAPVTTPATETGDNNQQEQHELSAHTCPVTGTGTCPAGGDPNCPAC